MVTRSSDRPILELRIHGVKNTLPHEMLGVKAPDVTQVRGDDLGGFWATPEPTADTPKDVHREAYSWGLLARTGGRALPLVGQLAVHIGWLFILPFGLCNVAYWTRRLEAQPDPLRWFPGRGAAVLRVFGLGLTLLYVTALASVAIDLLAVECFRGEAACTPLAGLLDPLSGLSRSQRVAILALGPLTAMVFIYLVAHRGRVSYEASVSSMATSLSREGVEALPALATPGFWSRARIGSTTERLHLAAVLLLLTLLICWDQVYSPLQECTRPGTYLENGCWLPDRAFGSAPVSAAVLLTASAALVIVVLMVMLASETPSGRSAGGSVPSPTERKLRQSTQVRRLRAAAGLLLGAGATLFAASVLTGLLTSTPDGKETGPAFLGLIVTPQALLAVLLAMALAALGWRGHRNRRLGGNAATEAPPAPPRYRPAPESLLLVAGLTLALVPYAQPGLISIPISQTLAAIALVAFLLVIAVRQSGRRGDGARTAWRGTAPGVVLLLSLGAAMTLASVLVVGVRVWLGIEVRRANDIYVEFGAVLLLVLLVLSAVLGVVLLLTLTKLPRLQSARIRDGGREIAPLLRYADGGPPRDPTEDRVEFRVLKARRLAALAQRGEPVLGLLAFLLALGITVTLAVDLRVGASAGDAQDVLDWLVGGAIGGLGAAAVAAVGIVAGNALTLKERPVGVLWDLICFLPRAGHPFGPPSYAERAVPEIEGRLRDWLEDGPRNARVVLSAHSLGAVLAIATLFARYAIEERRLGDVGLITYGTQTRAYFGRFFPELFGPRILGTRSCRGPSLFRTDPWRTQIDRDNRGGTETLGGTPVNPTLSRLLDTTGTPAWINVWRRTDFLGFPVHSYSNYGNPIDRGASEMEPGPYEKVATHSNYPAAEQFPAAFAAVVARIGSEPGKRRRGR